MIFYERAWRSLQHIETDMNVSVEVYERMGDLNQEFCRYRNSFDFYQIALEGATENDQKARILRKMAYIWGNLDDWAHSTKALQVLDQAMTLECVSALEKGEIFSTGAVLQFYQRDLQGAIGYSVKARDIFHSIEEREREFWERVNLSTYLFHEYQFENAWQELQRAGDLIDERIHKKALVQFIPKGPNKSFQEDCMMKASST